MTDLIKRDDALAAVNDWEELWYRAKEEILALPAIDPAATREAALQALIEELANSLAWYQKMDAMCSDHVVELTEKLEAAEAKLIKAMAFIRRHIPDSVYEQRQRANAFLAELEGENESH